MEYANMKNIVKNITKQTPKTRYSTTTKKKTNMRHVESADDSEHEFGNE